MLPVTFSAPSIGYPRDDPVSLKKVPSNPIPSPLRFADLYRPALFFAVLGVLGVFFRRVPPRFVAGVRFKLLPEVIARPPRIGEAEMIVSVGREAPGLFSLQYLPSVARIKSPLGSPYLLETRRELGEIATARFRLTAEGDIRLHFRSATTKEPFEIGSPPGSATHRFLTDNRYLWEGAPPGERHVLIAEVAAPRFLREGKAAPTLLTQGPFGQQIANIQQWQHGKSEPVYFLHEVVLGKDYFMAALVPSPVFLSRPAPGWYKLTFPLVSRDPSFAFNGSLLVQRDTVAGRFLASRQLKKGRTDVPGVFFLPSRTLREVLAKITVEDPRHKVPTDQFIDRILTPLLGQPLARGATSEEMARWVMFGVQPKRWS